MSHITKRTVQFSLIAGSLALSACGGSGGGGNNASADINAVAVSTTPSSGDLRSLLDQGLINGEAIDLSDNAIRQTDDRQDAFDL